MSKRDPTVRLLHMRDYAQKAVDMVQGQIRTDLDTDEKLMIFFGLPSRKAFLDSSEH